MPMKIRTLHQTNVMLISTLGPTLSAPDPSQSGNMLQAYITISTCPGHSSGKR